MEQDFTSENRDLDENPIELDREDDSMKKSKNLLSIILSALVFIFPIIFVSSSFVSFSSLKGYLFLIATYILIFVWTVTRLKKDTFVIPFNLLSLSAIIVLLVNLASTFLSDNFSVAFWGKDLGFDSSIYLLTLFLFLFIGSFILKEVKAASYTYMAFIGSAVLVLVFHILLILFPNIVPDLGYLFTNTTNTIGKWFDLGVFAGLVSIMSLISISLLNNSKRFKIALQSLLGLSLVILLVVGFLDLWIVVGVFSLFIFVYLLMVDRFSAANSDGQNKITIPISSLVVLIISATVILSSIGQVNPISSKIHNTLGINFVDVRPSITANYSVIKDSVIESPIVGKDFTSFDKAWIQYKPDSINLTDLWATDFRYGYGLIPTYFATTGVLGILSWLFFLGLLVYLGFSSIFRENRDVLGRYLLVSSFFSSLFLWTMAFIYIPSHVTLFLTFLFTSVFVGSLYRDRLLGVRKFAISKSPKYGFIYIFFVVILLISSITVSYNITEKFVSQVYARQGIVAFQQGNLELAQSKITSALTYNQTDTLFRNLSDIQQLRALQAQNNQEISETERATLFEGFVSAAIQSASAAVQYDPQNYSNYFYIGDLFTNLISLEIEGISDRAIEFMNEAKRLNPKNPEIPLALARIYLSQENYEQAKEQIDEAIDIKPNYTEAVYLLSQVNVAEGEIETAIENVQLTTLIRPNDPVTYFQLGLLQYQNQDYNDAVVSFETALTRNRLYANAKYFLGLSYYEVNRNQDAIQQFEELLEMNPGNQEVEFILSNLRSGQAPFAGASSNIPPIDDQPENRDTPPLDDDQAESAEESEAVPAETEIVGDEESENLEEPIQ